MPTRAARTTQSAFMRRSYQIYTDDAKRAAPDYTLEEFRAAMRAAVGSRCPYCNRLLDESNLSFDHKRPLKRGGEPSLDNGHFVCPGCNVRKGDLTHEEYAGLVGKLRELEAETRNPRLSESVLKRMAISNSYVIGKNRRERGGRRAAPPAEG